MLAWDLEKELRALVPRAWGEGDWDVAAEKCTSLPPPPPDMLTASSRVLDFPSPRQPSAGCSANFGSYQEALLLDPLQRQLHQRGLAGHDEVGFLRGQRHTCGKVSGTTRAQRTAEQLRACMATTFGLTTLNPACAPQ